MITLLVVNTIMWALLAIIFICGLEGDRTRDETIAATTLIIVSWALAAANLVAAVY